MAKIAGEIEVSMTLAEWEAIYAVVDAENKRRHEEEVAHMDRKGPKPPDYPNQTEFRGGRAIISMMLYKRSKK